MVTYWSGSLIGPWLDLHGQGMFNACIAKHVVMLQWQGLKPPVKFFFKEVYRMGVSTGMCPTASLRQVAHVASGESWPDSCKAVVLVLPVVEGHALRGKFGPGRMGVHLGQYSFEVGMTTSWSGQAQWVLSQPQGWEDVIGKTSRPGRVGIYLGLGWSNMAATNCWCAARLDSVDITMVGWPYPGGTGHWSGGYQHRLVWQDLRVDLSWTLLMLLHLECY